MSALASGKLIAPAKVQGPVLALSEGLSFWGGVDPDTGHIRDAYHPACGESLVGRIVMMPTSRGSCTGSGVLLELALNGKAPAALIFRESEDILTLGALIAGRMFDRHLAVLRLPAESYEALAACSEVAIHDDRVEAEDLSIPLERVDASVLELTAADRAMLDGQEGEAVQLAMEMICTMAASQGATALVDVTRGHIDGCIYASHANLRFAEAMLDLGARVRIPTTMNAISVDFGNWQAQGVDPAFGKPASRLAQAYVDMGARASFTCAPYLLDDAPTKGEAIAWAESNAVIYANSVLGARTVKHPDFLDLCIAMTGRAPMSGVYSDDARRARLIIHVELPSGHDDAFWPMMGWVAGRLAPDCIPLIRGLEAAAPNEDDLKALCAAFGTTSAAPILHVAGVTPEADNAALPDAREVTVGPADLLEAWIAFNQGGEQVELVAFGSPHFSIAECGKLAELLDGRQCKTGTTAIVTLGRDALAAVQADGTVERLKRAGVKVVADICWCSISEPVFPPEARNLMTNSGKYAHYAPGLSGRTVRFGNLAECAEAAVTGLAPRTPPTWLA